MSLAAAGRDDGRGERRRRGAVEDGAKAEQASSQAPASGDPREEEAGWGERGLKRQRTAALMSSLVVAQLN